MIEEILCADECSVSFNSLKPLYCDFFESIWDEGSYCLLLPYSLLSIKFGCLMSSSPVVACLMHCRYSLEWRCFRSSIIGVGSSFSQSKWAAFIPILLSFNFTSYLALHSDMLTFSSYWVSHPMCPLVEEVHLFSFSCRIDSEICSCRNLALLNEISRFSAGQAFRDPESSFMLPSTWEMPLKDVLGIVTAVLPHTAAVRANWRERNLWLLCRLIPRHFVVPLISDAYLQWITFFVVVVVINICK